MISIIVPVYNVEKYIGKCLQSILSQTYSDFEVLLINDGSTDSSYQICQTWAEKDERIKVITKENGGVSSARNLGLDLATGDFISFIDADDWISFDYLEKLMHYMTPDMDIVICECDEVNENNVVLDPLSTYKRGFSGEISKLEVLYDAYCIRTYARVVWAKLYRKELWNGIRFKPLIYTEDTYAIFEVFEKTNKFFYINEPLYRYFQRDTSVTHRFTLVHYENRIETLYFMQTRALEAYPIYRTTCTEEYLSHAYYVLKEYQRINRKCEALNLIQKMKFVYKHSKLKTTVLAYRLLILPKHAIYYLIRLKDHINQNLL